MTSKYHPVTEEEINQIECNSPDVIDTIQRVITTRTLIREITSRPDPLEILEAWRKWKDDNWQVGSASIVWTDESEIIQRLRENPSEVEQQGREAGWWPE